MNWSIILTLLAIEFAYSVAQLAGKLESCSNEGDPVPVDSIDQRRCYSCICKNGYVECNNSCPRIDECHMIVVDGCCKRCKGCVYQGVYHPSHTDWQSSTDPCTVLRCEAGVVTESNLHCYTPCANPLPPEPGKCCPTCPECKINAQVASDDRDVISDDPCLKCRCEGGRMICSKKACPVLQCNASRQNHPPGECCPVCKGTRALIEFRKSCTLQTSFFREGDNFNIDKCTSCTCQNDTSICKRAACPILDCAPDLQKSVPGSCCKKCIMPEEVRSKCTYGMKTYEDGQQWQLDPCKSCKCQRGMPSCAFTRCNVTSATCAPGTRLVHSKEECCPKCVEVEGMYACMAFGDPHYKTFDGKIYSFKGIGKYQLTADCDNRTFSVRVANTNRGPSSSTKRVAIKYSGIRINLQQKGRIKFNGQKIAPPYTLDGKFRAEKKKDNIKITLNNGVQIFWNGRSFVEVTAPASFKNKLCGLCGNFNSNVQDDLKTNTGRVVTDKEILAFGASWCVGRKSECEKKIKQNKPPYPLKKNFCKLFSSETFAACDSKLNYSKYYRACKMDMGHCSTGKCYCDSLMAYARECERLGVRLPNWQKHSSCDPASLKRAKLGNQRFHKSHREEALLRQLPKNFTRTRNSKEPLPLV